MNSLNKAMQHAIKNTEKKCKESPINVHIPQEKMGSITGYICKYCSKEIEQMCQVCNKGKSKCEDFNNYYGACEECF